MVIMVVEMVEVLVVMVTVVVDGGDDEVILPAGEGKWEDALLREDQANQEEGWKNNT